jgi:hypothetical protein
VCANRQLRIESVEVLRPDFSKRANIPDLYTRVWDEADYVVPPAENGAFFVATNVIITPNQTRGMYVGIEVEVGRARGPFLTSPLGANFDPQGRSCPPGVNLVP